MTERGPAAAIFEFPGSWDAIDAHYQERGWTDGLPIVPPTEAAVRELLRWTDRDILTMTFVGAVPADTLRAFLRMLTLDPEERRRRGGPARVWAAEGLNTIVVEQIDYAKVLPLLALDGNRTGPFSRVKLVDKLMPLAKNADVHVWNERLGDWKPPKDGLK